MNSNTKLSRQAIIPVWMLQKNEKESDKGKKISTGFLRKTMLDISKITQNEIFSERFVENGRFLQSIDTRVKLLTLLFFMIFSGLTRSILTLVFLAIIAIMYVKLSGLNLKNYFRRVWMIIPVLVLVLSIPAASSMFISGDPLVYLYKGLDFKVWFIRFPSEIYFSTNGLSAIIKMSLRIGVSISFGYLLVMTTRWSSLTKSLTVLRIPSLIISILNMTYRYIYVLSKITCELFEARFLRTVGRLRNKENRTFIASRISFLFVKSSFLSDEIYDSMRCRGYTGETVSLSSFKLSKVDLMWIINNVIIVLILFAI